MASWYLRDLSLLLFAGFLLLSDILITVKSKRDKCWSPVSRAGFKNKPLKYGEGVKTVAKDHSKIIEVGRDAHFLVGF